MALWTRLKDFVDTFADAEGNTQETSLGEEEVRLAAAALLVHATVVDGIVDRREGEVLRDVLERRFDLGHGDAGRLIKQAVEKEKEAVDLYGFTSILKSRLDRDGRLKIVLNEFEPPPIPIHVVHQEGRMVSAKVRAFVDHMVDRLRADASVN